MILWTLAIAIVTALIVLGRVRQLIDRHSNQATDAHHLERLIGRIYDLEQEVRDLRAQRAVAPGTGAATPPVPAHPAPVPIEAATGATPPAVQEPTAPEREVTESEVPEPGVPEQVEPSAPTAPAVPRVLPWWESLFAGANALVRIGVVVLFFGVAFLVKYAAEHIRFPIELRLVVVALAGLGMVELGRRLRHEREGYALSLQGGGIGVLYLTAYAAFRLYQLLPPPVAFATLLAIAVGAGVLAVAQDALALAFLGALGGFIAPLLASSGSGNHVLLFGYYLVLNLGVLGVAWRKAWRPLNLLGFVSTFVIATLWGVLAYSPQHFASTEPFLVAFFALYVAVAVLYAWHRSLELRDYVDGTLVFGTPVAAFALQAALVKGTEYGVGWTAAGLGVCYLGLAAIVRRVPRPPLQSLAAAFGAIGGSFATLAIPYFFSNEVTTAIWALEGVAITWFGLRQDRRAAAGAGLALQLVAAGLFILEAGLGAHSEQAFLLNARFLDAVLIAAAALVSACQLGRRPDALWRGAGVLEAPWFAWGMLWWLVAAADEVARHFPDRVPIGWLLLVTLTAVAGLLTRRALQWRLASTPAALLLPVLYVVAGYWAVSGVHPLAQLGGLAWPAALLVCIAFLRWHEDELRPRSFHALHAGWVWLAVVLATWESAWQVRDRWPHLDNGVVIAVSLASLVSLAALSRVRPGLRWPFGPTSRAYVLVAAAPLAVYLWCWTLVANLVNDGALGAIPYLPVASALDLTCLAVFGVLTAWYRRAREYALELQVTPAMVWGALSIVAFVWLNGVLLRSIHHWAGVGYTPHALLASTLVQTALSVFWTMLAVLAMLFATRRAERALWLAGAGLLAVVVVKLFTVDLSQLAGVARIVSFLVVGLLLLAIGYFSPLPPRARATA